MLRVECVCVYATGSKVVVWVFYNAWLNNIFWDDRYSTFPGGAYGRLARPCAYAIFWVTIISGVRIIQPCFVRLYPLLC